MQMSSVARAHTAKSSGLRIDSENLAHDWKMVGQDIMCAAKKVFAQNNS